MRLINVDELKLPQHFFETVDNVPKFYEWLNEQPTIDAVPVIRCKECKWWYDISGSKKMIGMGACCYKLKPMRLGFMTPSDWYCADGERKDDETD